MMRSDDDGQSVVATSRPASASDHRLGAWFCGFVGRTTGMTKGQVRTSVLRQLKQLREEERRRKSEAIWRKVSRLTAFRQARTVCCYVSLPYEVQTWRMIQRMLLRGKRVVVPVTQPRTKRLMLSEVRDPEAELAPRAFGVWEPLPLLRRPVPVRDLDLVIVPGVAFDRRGHRLGHGHGYFDRFLGRLPKTTPTIGVAFRCQLLDRLPTAPHDRAVQTLLIA